MIHMVHQIQVLGPCYLHEMWSYERFMSVIFVCCRQSKKKTNIFVCRLYLCLRVRGYFLQQGAFLRDDPYKASELKKYYILRQNYLNKRYKLLLPPFQIIRRFGFSTYIIFAMYLDIVYI